MGRGSADDDVLKDILGDEIDNDRLDERRVDNRGPPRHQYNPQSRSERVYRHDWDRHHSRDREYRDRRDYPEPVPREYYREDYYPYDDHRYDTGYYSHPPEYQYKESQDHRRHISYEGRDAHGRRDSERAPYSAPPVIEAARKEGPLEDKANGRSSEPKASSRFAPIVFDLKLPERVRFFTARCNYYDIFVRSRKYGQWKVPLYVASPLRKAASEDNARIMILFHVTGTQYWQGLAELDRSRPIFFAPEKSFARVPLNWLCVADVPFTECPSVPGLLDPHDNEIPESFEMPNVYGCQFFALFAKSMKEDRATNIDTKKFDDLLEQYSPQ